MDKFLVAPSTDPAKTDEDLQLYVKQLESVADILHCDVMDGKFVERKTIDYKQIKEIRNISSLFLDVHLMIEKPECYIQKYAESGANLITVHYESFKDKKQLKNCLKNIKEKGCLVGLSIKPDTAVSEIEEYLPIIDLCLVMSVYPGKSGQTFIESSFDKVKQLSDIRSEYKLNFKIEVDGGVNGPIAQKLKALGTDIVVSGSFVYNSENREQAIKSLKNF